MKSWSWLTAEMIVIPDCVRSDPVSDDTLEGDKVVSSKWSALVRVRLLV